MIGNQGNSIPSVDIVPGEVLEIIFGRLPSHTLAICSGVCVAWKQLASAEDTWAGRLDMLTAGKQFCGDVVLMQPSNKLKYFSAIRDCTRTAISRDELVSLEYCFRFKMAAGPSWAEQDPWWQGRESIKLKLREDGTVTPLNDARPFWGRPGQVAGRWKYTLEDGVAMVTMNGHPSYHVCRHPIHWGVFMQSCWCVWAGFPMAPRGVDACMEDQALQVTIDDPRQLREVQRYNRAVSQTRQDGGYY
eukprot:gnl/MRDRNA2_/MRDRNA2_26139_c0_seq2.p1 gnl/MRDRNA2_/MRDRNA2_26139_c0~~gnl/MRDRNA2_/MRDRNA2_26139_c0_seq2.p1  ORF type:complete len:246 (-),score=31.11 gnl/MRDRNA2_/MRDRNA2_26139_c0_seq2:19-756(-)